ncbi:flagellin [Sandarakinorhabdus sp.]|uniref:flagellin N-terminal helical domain-containing protein n=1 Tax=Sandarakinorhabdus sp. TaxID=1916663 RepID=UPI00286E191E|nr:flagellin [Sandarakinorhabdus sp.]
MNPVSSRSGHAGAVQRLVRLGSEISETQAQISLAKRVVTPDDDPVAFVRAATLRRADLASTATGRAIDSADRRLSATDTALDSITSIVQRLRELALQGANGTLNAGDRLLISEEVGELAEAFSGLAEARGADGEPLFGGAAHGGPAYAPDAAGVLQWQGYGQAPMVAAGGGLIAGGIEGPQAFGSSDAVTGRESIFDTFANLGKALVEPNPIVRAAAMDGAIGQIDGHVTRLADARAIVGARQSRLGTEGERITREKLTTAVDLSRLEDLDMSEAIARMQRLLTILEAAQASFARTASLSLWDKLG